MEIIGFTQWPEEAERRISEHQELHWDELEEFDGKRVSLPMGYMGLEKAELPEGWVVDGCLDEEVRSRILADAIPLKPVEEGAEGWENAQGMIQEATELLDAHPDNILLLALHEPDKYYAKDKEWTIKFIEKWWLSLEYPIDLIEVSDKPDLWGYPPQVSQNLMFAYRVIKGKYKGPF